MYRVAIVCEGPTDKVIIEAVLDYLLDDYISIPIQPPTGCIGGDAGPFGGGWKGVRSWCKGEVALQGGLKSAGITGNSDLLIIQIDADVVADPEIGLAKPCPPPDNNVNETRSLINDWLDVQDIPENVVFCVPSMASETWALVALFPNDPSIVPCDTLGKNGQCIECRTDIKKLMKHLGRQFRPKLVRSKRNGELKNLAPGYFAKQEKISKAWNDVVKVCGQAARFTNELRDVLQLDVAI